MLEVFSEMMYELFVPPRREAHAVMPTKAGFQVIETASLPPWGRRLSCDLRRGDRSGGVTAPTESTELTRCLG